MAVAVGCVCCPYFHRVLSLNLPPPPGCFDKEKKEFGVGVEVPWVLLQPLKQPPLFLCFFPSKNGVLGWGGGWGGRSVHAREAAHPGAHPPRLALGRSVGRSDHRPFSPEGALPHLLPPCALLPPRPSAPQRPAPQGRAGVQA